MVRIVPATGDMVKAYGEPIPRSARMLAAVDGDRVLGIAGVYPEKARQVAFMSISDELRRHPIAVVKASRGFMRWVRESRLPTHAMCDEGIESAARFLEYLGFRHVQKGVYVCLG